MKEGMGRLLACFWSACLLALCLACGVLSPVAVRADVLTEVEDSFWERHYRDCENIYRRYVANSPDGYVVIWDSPTSSRKNEVVLNGTELVGSWHYADSEGEIWYIIEDGHNRLNGKNEARGWVRVSDCLVVPDYISFREVYQKEFVEYDPVYDHAFDGAEQVVLWDYPCCETERTYPLNAEWFQGDSSPRDYFSAFWRDPQGRMWAFTEYCYGIRNKWICLDDPAGTEWEKLEFLSGDAPIYPSADAVIYPPADAVGEISDAEGSEETDNDIVVKEEKGGVTEPLLPQSAVVYPPAEKLPMMKNGVTWLAIAGVLAVVAVTAGLMWFFFGRKKEIRKD